MNNQKNKAQKNDCFKKANPYYFLIWKKRTRGPLLAKCLARQKNNNSAAVPTYAHNMQTKP